jgi:hypothetical protein
MVNSNDEWTMNRDYERTMNRDYERTMNDERWIGTMNERTNDRMIGRTNDWNFGSIKAEQRLFGQTIGRSDKLMNEPWTIRRTNKQTMNMWTKNDRPNDPCACVVLVWEWEWGEKWVAMKWLGVAWGEGLAPLLIGKVGDYGEEARISGRMRGLVGDKHVLVMYKW